MRKVIAVVIAIISATGATRAWISLNSNYSGSGVAIAAFANGDLVTTQQTSETYPVVQLVRLDGSTGEFLWQTDLTTGALYDSASQIAVDSGGDVITMNTSGAIVCKVDGTSGNILWKVHLPGAASYGSFAIDASGDVLVGGTAHYGSGRTQELFAKLAGASGGVLWTALGPTDDPTTYVASVTTDAGGDLFVASISNSLDGLSHTVVRRLAGSNGQSIWSSSLPAPPGILDRATDARFDGSGHLVVLLTDTVYDGSPKLAGPGNTADGGWALVSVDAGSGELVWRTEAHSSNKTAFGSSPAALAIGSGGEIYACGNLSTPFSGGTRSFTVIAWSSTGVELWRSTPGGGRGGPTLFGFASDLTVAPDGAIVATGSVLRKKDGNGALFVTSLRARDGHANWEASYSTGTQGGSGSSLVVDAAGAIGVAGSLHDGFAPDGPAVLKLNANGTSYGELSLGITPKPVTREIRN